MQICSPLGNVSQIPSTAHHLVQSSLNSGLISNLRIKVRSVYWLKEYWRYLRLFFNIVVFRIKYYIYKFQNKNFILLYDYSVDLLFFVLYSDFSFHSSYSHFISLISVYLVYLHFCLQNHHESTFDTQ